MNNIEQLPARAFKQVMLIDNSDIDNYINHKKLEMVNFADDIKVYNNPVIALNELVGLYEAEKHNELPELIFLDLFMPQMNGDAFLKEMRTINPGKSNELPVILLSSYLRADVVEDLGKQFSNIIGFIEKPLIEKDLVKAYNKVTYTAA